MLTSGFSESNEPDTANGQSTTVIRPEALEGEYDYESDSDLDEEDSESVVATSGSEDDTYSEPTGSLKGKSKAEHSCMIPAIDRDMNGQQTIRRRILLPNIAYRT